jgi:hypothetical protein
MQLDEKAHKDGQFVMTVEAYMNMFAYTIFQYEPNHSKAKPFTNVEDPQLSSQI